MSNNQILILEDDEALGNALKLTFTNEGYGVCLVNNFNDAKQKLKEEKYHLLLCDVQLNNTSSIALFSDFVDIIQAVPTVFMTAYGKINDAVKAMQMGAVDYILKPFESSEIIEKIQSICAASNNTYRNNNAVCESKQMKNVFLKAKQVAKTHATVLISGESGTGKEVVSQLIHNESNRKGNFIAIKCAAIPEQMLESMLFGFEKGAFTGAIQTTEGKFELANHGTLLLDEISEMSLSLQSKLLRVLQEKEVERIGGKKVIKLDVRVIATTNRNLKLEVESGRFRSDLYFRLNVFPLHVSPLRDRADDILPLAQHFLKQLGNNQSLTISEEASAKLLRYTWPGNVRELQNVIHRAIVVSEGKSIQSKHILFDSVEDAISQSKGNILNDSLKNQESDIILKILSECNGNRELCSEKLGISARTLRYKLARMKKMGIRID